MKARSIRAAIALARDDSRTVERPGPGKAPTAFRIWKAGPNVTDHGTHTLSAASVRAILSTQAARGNLFSIDVDHLSLSPDAPPEARKSVGWMRLASRPDEAGEPELWAVDVEWTDTIRAGLEKDPPEWRYFSPAYDCDKGGEITRYLNTALTNNPATWRVTALATAPKESSMTIEELIAELQKLADAGDEKAKKALLSLAEPTSETTTSETTAEETKTASSDAPPGEEKKEPPVAATLATILATVQGLAQKVSSLEADKEQTERAGLIASRPDLAKEVVSVLAKAPISLLREAVKTIPVTQRNPAAAAQADVKASVGATQGAAVSNQSPDAAEMDRRMGLAPRSAAVVDRGDVVVFGTMRPADAQASIARRAAQASKDGAK